jgi:hypothetical protein
VNAQLQFQLPEEEREFLLASRAQLMSSVLHDIDQELRNYLKYENKEYFKTAEELAQYIRQQYTIPALNQINPDV